MCSEKWLENEKDHVKEQTILKCFDNRDADGVRVLEHRRSARERETS
jgi:hypothetical protein